MATNPPAAGTIALTEKKMNMSLDEIINMSKKKNSLKERRPQRMPIKTQGFQKFGPQKGFNRAPQFAESKSAVRQGVLAQRRTNFNEKSNFPITGKIAKKTGNFNERNNFSVTNKPMWNRPRPGPTFTQNSMYVQNKAASNSSFTPHPKKPQTMDALFSRMQQERKKTNPKLTSGSFTSRQVAHRPPPAQHYKRQGGRGLATDFNAY